MKSALVFVDQQLAGVFEQHADGQYRFQYHSEYQGAPVSLTLRLRREVYNFAFLFLNSFCHIKRIVTPCNIYPFYLDFHFKFI